MVWPNPTFNVFFFYRDLLALQDPVALLVPTVQM